MKILSALITLIALLLLLPIDCQASETKDSLDPIPIWINPGYDVQHVETGYGVFIIMDNQSSIEVTNYLDSLEGIGRLYVETEKALNGCFDIQLTHDRQVATLQDQIKEGQNYIASKEREKKAILNQNQILTEDNKKLFEQNENLRRKNKRLKKSTGAFIGISSGLAATIAGLIIVLVK